MTTVAVAMPVKSMRHTAEAAIGCAAIGPAVRARHRRAPGPAALSRHKAHRHGADGCRSHHGQDDAARAFHVAALGYARRTADSLSAGGQEASKSQLLHGIVRHAPPSQPPPEKCAVKA